MVSFTLDTPELAAQYDVVGQRQFSHGKLLIQVYTASLSSSFGNHLSGLSADELSKVRAVFDRELEKRRVRDGIRLERHLIFAVAQKPLVS